MAPSSTHRACSRSIIAGDFMFKIESTVDLLSSIAYTIHRNGMIDYLKRHGTKRVWEVKYLGCFLECTTIASTPQHYPSPTSNLTNSNDLNALPVLKSQKRYFVLDRLQDSSRVILFSALQRLVLHRQALQAEWETNRHQLYLFEYWTSLYLQRFSKIENLIEIKVRKAIFPFELSLIWHR